MTIGELPISYKDWRACPTRTVPQVRLVCWQDQLSRWRLVFRRRRHRTIAKLGRPCAPPAHCPLAPRSPRRVWTGKPPSPLRNLLVGFAIACADETGTPLPNSTYVILCDDVLKSLLAEACRVESMTLTRKRFAAICLQAMRNGEDDPARALMRSDEIRDLLTDPLNANTASLSIATLRKLCWQAMTCADQDSAPVSRPHYRANARPQSPGKRS